MPRKPKESNKTDIRVSTGVAGLDEIMNQGFVPQRVYLVRGGPGSGKSTLGLHFLTAGAGSGEKVLFITMGEIESQVSKNAQRIGFDPKGVSSLDLAPRPEDDLPLLQHWAQYRYVWVKVPLQGILQLMEAGS